jgi:two-component system chemotaxis sensor kinase CheA
VPTPATPPDNLFFVEFLDDFFAECDEHLAIVRRSILALEATAGQPQTTQSPIGELLRSFHTLKGLAGMVGVESVEQLAHQTESYLRALSQGQATLTTEALGALTAGTQMVEQVLAAYRTQLPPPDVAPIVARLSALVPIAPPQPAAHRQATNGTAQPVASAEEQARLDSAIERGTALWRIVFVPTAQLTERNINVNAVRERLESIGEIVRAAPQVLGPGKIAFEFLVAAAVDAATLEAWHGDGISATRYTPPEPAAPPLQPAVATAPSSVVRVDLARIDDVIRMVGELTISRARLNAQLEPVEHSVPVPAWRALQETAQAIERQLRQLRQGVIQMRLVPIGETFARMQFVVHDLARESHKQVALELQGQATEIDKFVVERMLDPLLHLVRNAVSHGLESTEERIAQGKPAAGRIVLRATTAGDVVLIEIEDDGRGIDSEHVARRARALGIIGADESLNPDMLLDVLCVPGFSTRAQADRVSGRGVGMEVVKQTVQELGGVLSLDTAIGRGSHFIIQLPLTLAIVDALIVIVGEQTFAVPMPSVREIVDVLPERLTVVEKNELLNDRSGVLPLLRLARHFGLAERADGARYALVVGSGLRVRGLVVDKIFNKREIVVRALADPLIKVDGLMGATELGEGRPVLILDVPALTYAGRPGERATASPARSGENGSERGMAETQPATETYVLCELAGATYGIPSQLVRQIEMVEQITPVPNAPPAVVGVVFSRGQVIPAIDLRLRFGFAQIPYTLRSRLIVVAIGERTVGLIVDTAREFVKIAADIIQPPPEAIAGLSGAYLKGIAKIGERLVVLLGLDEVLFGAEIAAPVAES